MYAGGSARSLEKRYHKMSKTKQYPYIPCSRCNSKFAPTRTQYRRFKSNKKTFCSSECRWTRDYNYKIHDNHVSVFVDDSELLVDFDIFEKYKKTFYIKKDTKKDYVSVSVFLNGKKSKLSRLILSVTDKKIEVDHVNGNTLDNRRSNLRVVTHQENMMNKANYKNNTSKIKGVSFNKKKGLWVARIQVGKNRIFLGSSKDKAVAENLRFEAERKYFGKYDRKFLKKDIV